MSEEQFPRITLGVSSCLLGEKVRYNAEHKRNAYILGPLSDFFDYVSVCPEVAIGLGTPRPPIHLVRRGREETRLCQSDAHDVDMTEAMEQYALKTVERLRGRISGYILKSKSPSCGMERVKVYTEKKTPAGVARGKFAEVLMRQWPQLPVEEEGRLNDPLLRENFIQRVYVYHRWQQLEARGIEAADLIGFHTRHKLLLMAHNQAAYRALGHLLAAAGQQDMEELARDYISRMMAALSKPATRKNHSNVLLHLMGYLKRPLETDDKREIREVIESYRLGEVPLVVPLTLLRHHFRRHPNDYVAGQVYLDPYPAELMLRNNV